MEKKWAGPLNITDVEKIEVGKKLTDYFFLLGKRMTSQFLARGRNGPARSFPRERLAVGGGGKQTIMPVLLLQFILIVIVCFLFVFDDLLVLFKIAWWTSAGKKLTSWLSACAVLLYVVLIFCVPFLYAVLEGCGIHLYRLTLILLLT